MALLNKQGIDVRTGKIRNNGQMPETQVSQLNLDEQRETLYLRHIEALEMRLGKVFQHARAFNCQQPNDINSVFGWDDLSLCKGYAGLSDLNDHKDREDGKKEYYDPADVSRDNLHNEIITFNIEKTLRAQNRLWLTKIIPLSTLEKLTKDNAWFDGIARRQHERAVMLNQASAKEQKQYESGKRLKQMLLVLLAGIGIVLTTTMVIVPRMNYQGALDLFRRKDYPAALNAFLELGTYGDTPLYGTYCKAKQAAASKEYDQAKALYEKLAGNRAALSVYDIDLIYDIEHCDYEKALEMYTDKKYDEAMGIFLQIRDHEKALEYYYKCGYQIAQDHYESGRLNEALDAFYLVRNYSDSRQRLDSIADERYSQAASYYANSRYDDAAPIYEFLSGYGYKDSKSMMLQCFYRKGLDLYARGSYQEAREQFENVLEFKDSNALAKECTYRLAKTKQASSVEEALKEYLSISEYRDVAGMLEQPVFSIYGEWEILEMNGTKWPSVCEFSFNTGGVLLCKNNLKAVALSTEAASVPYSWNGKEYVHKEYSLTVREGRDGLTEFVAKYKGEQVIYTCRRKASYLAMLAHNAAQSGEELDEGISPAAKLLQQYVDLKLDGIFHLPDGDFDCFSVLS